MSDIIPIREVGHVKQAKPKLKKPRLYKVVLLNDDYTPMEFVVYVLRNLFLMEEELAITVMLNVHNNGRGVCGVFAREVAEMKVRDVLEFARRYQHPLQCTMEPE
ncbi:MAG: ATP-dependent Clp protease adapter ClpS [Acidiferrobacterales bacterium]|nr:ATP-dependent Clp protease adapter ClpS [Acidiferrobacterales bacterium]